MTRQLSDHSYPLFFCSVFQLCSVPPQSAPQWSIADPHLCCWQMRECCCVTGFLSHADIIRCLSPSFTSVLSSSRAQMSIEPLWPGDKPRETNEDFPRCQNISNDSCEKSQKQHTAFNVWKHKVGDRKSKSRRGRRLRCVQHPFGFTGLWSVCWIGSQLGVMWSGLGSAPAGPRPRLSAGGRGSSLAGEAWASARERTSSGFSGSKSSSVFW